MTERDLWLLAMANYDEYSGAHKAPGPGTGFPIHDMHSGGDKYELGGVPEDWQTHPHYYAAPYEAPGIKGMREVQQVYNRANGNPDALVDIYRALPHNNIDFHTGDWVTPSLAYARQHAKQFGPTPASDWPVIKSTVPAKHLWQNGDSYYEMGYHGPSHEGTVVGAQPKLAAGFTPGPQDFVHYTSPERVQSIMENGLRPSRGEAGYGAYMTPMGNDYPERNYGGNVGIHVRFTPQKTLHIGPEDGDPGYEKYRDAARENYGRPDLALAKEGYDSTYYKDPWGGHQFIVHDPSKAEIVGPITPHKQASTFGPEGEWESGDWHGPDFHEHKYDRQILNDPHREPHQWTMKDHVPSDYDWLKGYPFGNDDHNRLMENPPSGKWYHTTSYDLEPGTRLTPGGGQSPDETYYSEWDGRKNRPNHVWLSGTPEQAKDWRYWAGGDAAKIYEVHPGATPQAWQNDPGQGYVVPHATVKRRVSVQQPHPGLQLHYFPDQESVDKAYGAGGEIQAPVVTAHHPDSKYQPTGFLQWDTADHPERPNVISWVDVDPDFRRQGIGAAMFEHAKQFNPDLQHSPQRSIEGDDWAHAVGGDLPPLMDEEDEDY